MGSTATHTLSTGIHPMSGLAVAVNGSGATLS
jgi:hypothetical protein